MPSIIPVRRNVLHRGAAAPPAGFNLVAHVTSGYSSANPVNTSGIDTTGVTLIVVAAGQSGGFTTGTLSDSKSNTWTGLTAQSNGAGTNTRLFYCLSPTVGAGHTFTLNNGGAFIQGIVCVQAWNGGTGTFDVQSGATGFGTTFQPGSVTPSVNNSLIVTSIFNNNSAASHSINSGFTVSDHVDAGAAFGAAMAYFVQGTAGAINPTWSFTGGGADNAAAIATFKP